MDGYAFAGQWLATAEPLALPVAGTVLAGQPWTGDIPAGNALRIMTGAMLPPGLDTVVPFELCQLEDPADAAAPTVRLPAPDCAPAPTAASAARNWRQAPPPCLPAPAWVLPSWAWPPAWAWPS
jgi:hypothetical protein